MSRFWVNPDGLQDNANGFNDISDSLNMVNGTFQTDIGGLYNSLGDGQDVNSFKENFTPTMEQFSTGMDSLAKALLETADGVKSMAKLFTGTEDNNINMLNYFASRPPTTTDDGNQNSTGDGNNSNSDSSIAQPREDELMPTSPDSLPPNSTNLVSSPDSLPANATAQSMASGSELIPESSMPLTPSTEAVPRSDEVRPS